jgi:hypothetical protein
MPPSTRSTPAARQTSFSRSRASMLSSPPKTTSTPSSAEGRSASARSATFASMRSEGSRSVARAATTSALARPRSASRKSTLRVRFERSTRVAVEHGDAAHAEQRELLDHFVADRAHPCDQRVRGREPVGVEPVDQTVARVAVVGETGVRLRADLGHAPTSRIIDGSGSTSRSPCASSRSSRPRSRTRAPSSSEASARAAPPLRRLPDEDHAKRGPVVGVHQQHRPVARRSEGPDHGAAHRDDEADRGSEGLGARRLGHQRTRVAWAPGRLGRAAALARIEWAQRGAAAGRAAAVVDLGEQRGGVGGGTARGSPGSARSRRRARSGRR